MTWKQTSVFPRHVLSESCNFIVPLLNRGRRESRAPTAPAAPCAMGRQERTRFWQVQPRHPGFPRAMALRLIRALPGERPLLSPLPSPHRQGG